MVAMGFGVRQTGSVPALPGFPSRTLGLPHKVVEKKECNPVCKVHMEEGAVGRKVKRNSLSWLAFYLCTMAPTSHICIPPS